MIQELKDKQENIPMNLIIIIKTMFKGKTLLTNKLKNGNQLQLFKETPNNTQMLKK